MYCLYHSIKYIYIYIIIKITQNTLNKLRRWLLLSWSDMIDTVPVRGPEGLHVWYEHGVLTETSPSIWVPE